MKTPFGSLGGGCREKKGFLHHCVLMGQNIECHLQSLMSCRKAVLYSYPPPPSCPLQLGNCSLPFLTLAERGWAGSKLLPQHDTHAAGGDPTLNHCQSWETEIAASQFWIQACKSQLWQRLQWTKPIQKRQLGVNSYHPERRSCSFHLLVGWTLPSKSGRTFQPGILALVTLIQRASSEKTCTTSASAQRECSSFADLRRSMFEMASCRRSRSLQPRAPLTALLFQGYYKLPLQSLIPKPEILLHYK